MIWIRIHGGRCCITRSRGYFLPPRVWHGMPLNIAVGNNHPPAPIYVSWYCHTPQLLININLNSITYYEDIFS